MERVEAIDARMVRRVVVVVVMRVAGGRGHTHETLQVAVGMRVRTHAG